MSKNITGLSGRIVRAMKRELDPKAFTRAQAQRLIACTTDSGLIQAFMGHQNKHVKRYCTHKLGLLAAAAQPPQVQVRMVALETHQDDTVGIMLPTEAKSPAIDLAAQYGEPIAFVESLVTEKGGDMAAVKRSLISRKSARTRAAKASATV